MMPSRREGKGRVPRDPSPELSASSHGLGGCGENSPYPRAHPPPYLSKHILPVEPCSPYPLNAEKE